MAEGQSMTSSGVVAERVVDEHADFVHEAVAVVAAELMEAGIAAEIGAGRGEVSPGESRTETGIGPGCGRRGSGGLELAIPRKAGWVVVFPVVFGAASAV